MSFFRTYQSFLLLVTILLIGLIFKLDTNIIVAIIASAGTALAWIQNKKAEREESLARQREERYIKLLVNVKGFYNNHVNNSKKLREEFLDEMKLCWLYAPDEIIKASNAFLITRTKNLPKQEDSGKKLAVLLLALRKDIGIRTKLTEEDFLLIYAC